MQDGYQDIKIDYRTPDYRSPVIQSNFIRDLQGVMQMKMAQEQAAERRFDKALEESNEAYGIDWVSDGAKQEFEKIMKDAGVDHDTWMDINYKNPAEVRSFRLKLKNAINNSRAEQLVTSNEYLKKYMDDHRALHIKGEISDEAHGMGIDAYNTILEDPELWGNSDYLRKITPRSLTETSYFETLVDEGKTNVTIDAKLLYSNDKEATYNNFANLTAEEIENISLSDIVKIERKYNYDPEKIFEQIKNKMTSDSTARRSFFNQARLGLYGEDLKNLFKSVNGDLTGAVSLSEDQSNKAYKVLRDRVIAGMKDQEQQIVKYRLGDERLQLSEELQLLNLKSDIEKAKLKKLQQQIDEGELQGDLTYAQKITYNSKDAADYNAKDDFRTSYLHAVHGTNLVTKSSGGFKLDATAGDTSAFPLVGFTQGVAEVYHSSLNYTSPNNEKMAPGDARHYAELALMQVPPKDWKEGKSENIEDELIIQKDERGLPKKDVLTLSNMMSDYDLVIINKTDSSFQGSFNSDDGETNFQIGIPDGKYEKFAKWYKGVIEYNIGRLKKTNKKAYRHQIDRMQDYLDNFDKHVNENIYYKDPRKRNKEKQYTVFPMPITFQKPMNQSFDQVKDINYPDLK